MSRPIVLPVPTDAAPARFLSPRRAWTILLLVWFAVHFAALFSPPLLDDADATHANAAQHMALSGDWVTLKVNGIRYLEKAPLPYWLTAIDYQIFGYNVFSAHFPMALGVLATRNPRLVLDAPRLQRPRCLLCRADAANRCRRLSLHSHRYTGVAAHLLHRARALLLSRGTRRQEARALLCDMGIAGSRDAGQGADRSGLLFRRGIAVACVHRRMATLARVAACHRPAALPGNCRAVAYPRRVRNPDQGNPVGNHPTPGHVHGFFYFYFINEQVLRFLGKRYPEDYNKQPFWVYWVGQLAWLCPGACICRSSCAAPGAPAHNG